MNRFGEKSPTEQLLCLTVHRLVPQKVERPDLSLNKKPQKMSSKGKCGLQTFCERNCNERIMITGMFRRRQVKKP